MANSNYIPQKFPHEWLPEKVELKTWEQIERAVQPHLKALRGAWRALQAEVTVRSSQQARTLLLRGVMAGMFLQQL